MASRHDRRPIVADLVLLDDSEGTEEFKVSLLLHAAFLLFLTAWFAWRTTDAMRLPQVCPIRLVGPFQEARPGSGDKVLPKAASQLRSGTARRLSPGKRPTVVRKPRSPSRIKTAPRPQGPTVDRVLQPGDTRKPGAVSRPDATVVNPSVVQESTSSVTPARPYVPRPAMEEVSFAMSDPAAASPLAAALVGTELGDPMESELPGEDPAGPLPEGSGNVSENPSGLPGAAAEPGGGEVQVDGIESLGGSTERFEPPKILSKVLPDYPEWARRKGVRGQAVYKVLVQQAGTVGDVMTMSSTIDPQLAILGAQSMRRWVFTPVLVGGEPRETWVQVTVQFKLN